MKPGGSSLNPNAAAYVPLSKRQAYSADEVLRSTKPATHHVQQYRPHYVPHFQGMGSYPGSQMPMPKNMVYNHQMKDEDLEMDMDIEFLLVTFSDLSHESINDVYMANNGDLDATIEMLNQLEIYSTEAQEYLPDTLDIGDVPETITETSTSTASKQKNEASASLSSSGTHKATVPPPSSS
ncbi:Polyadenylate-binding protein-interacting protein 6 [Cardamine amara subsp. amara]|uniref:Polyadenylate-binding protein-interacting protein 6 n=1 Tax=Cardamine amara subsp. amara TaxID=228776 RepID=A0ABD1B1T2_CARAN